MGIPQNRHPVLFTQRGQRCREFFVIRRPILRHTAGDLFCRRFIAGGIERRVSKRGQRAQAGFPLARIQQCAIRWPVEVNHIAGIVRLQHACAHVCGEGVELLHMPVCIRHGTRFLAQPRGNIFGQCRTRMGNADEQWQRAFLKLEHPNAVT